MLCKRRQCAASIHQWLAVMHILCLPYTNFVCILNRKTVAIQWNRKLKLSTLRFGSTTIPIYTEMHNPLPFHTENRKFKTSTARKESNVVSKIRIFIDLLQRGGGESLLYFYQNSWSPHMGYVCTYKKDSIIYAIVWFPIKLTTNWWYYELMLYTYSLSFPSSSFCWNIFFRISIVLVEVVKLDCFLETINFHQNREQKFRK